MGSWQVGKWLPTSHHSTALLGVRPSISLLRWTDHLAPCGVNFDDVKCLLVHIVRLATSRQTISRVKTSVSVGVLSVTCSVKYGLGFFLWSDSKFLQAFPRVKDFVQEKMSRKPSYSFV